MSLFDWLVGQKPKKTRSARHGKPQTTRQRRRLARSRDEADLDRQIQEEENFNRWRSGLPRKVRKRPVSFRNPTGT